MYKKIELRMLIASAILISIFLIQQLTTTLIMANYQEMSNVINTAGRQRMLSQKISKDVAMLRQDYNADIQEHYVAELDKSIKELSVNHRNLIEHDNSELVQHMFEDLDGVKDDFLTGAQNAIDYIGSEEPYDIQKLITARRTVLSYENEFLTLMDGIVDQYNWEAEQSFEWIRRVEFTFFIFLVVSIIVLIAIVFVPAHKTFRELYLEASENSTNMLRLFDIMRNALFMVTDEGKIILYNKKSEDMLNKLTIDKSITFVNELFEEASVSWEEIKNKMVDSDYLSTVEVTFEKHTPIIAEASVSSGLYQGQEVMLLNLYDVTTQKKVEETLTNLVIKDNLTGLYNRYHLENIIDDEINRAERYDIPLSIIILDLDHFKKINDYWGHPIGDQILKQTATILLENIRKADTVFRLGGEEFVILLSHTNLIGADQVAEKVRQAIEKSIHATVGKYTASFGVAQRKPGETFRSLYHRVDKALYAAKNSGRNCVRKADESSNEISLALKWKASWNSGESNIDDQHKTLFRLANELINTSREEGRDDVFMERLDGLMKHIRMHFEYEESVLKKIQYRHYPRHQKIHSQLLKRGDELRDQVETEEVTLQILIDYIFDDVIIGHMLREDILFFPYL